MIGGSVQSHLAPLRAWGGTLRAGKAHRLRLRRRVVIAGAGIAIMIGSAACPPAPRLVWNTSASAPVGLYAVTPGAWIEPGDMVIARVPAEYRRLAAERRYLPSNVPLVKRAAATAGDEICALGLRIFRNGEPIAARRAADRQGRLMPLWSGCVRLHGRQLFLLTAHPASFDGRYVGITDGADVIGKARLLWRG